MFVFPELIEESGQFRKLIFGDMFKIYNQLRLPAVAALARHHCGCPGNFGGCDNIINSLPDVI